MDESETALEDHKTQIESILESLGQIPQPYDDAELKK
jgi:hypothetical protein